MICIEFEFPLTDNARLNQTISLFQMPNIIRSTIQSDGYGACLTRLCPLLPNSGYTLQN